MNLTRSFYPEAQIDNFTGIDGTIQFYLKVKALYGSAKPRVLDFGAGRGAWTEIETSNTIRQIRDLRIGAGEVVAADVDGAVLQNGCSTRQVQLSLGRPLPFQDGYFDIVVADYVFEHIAEPEAAAKELLRIVRQGGWICARTANKYGYVAIAARLIPNSLHRRSLKAVQPDRVDVDVFPTTYALSSPAAIRRYFPGRKIIFMRGSAEPNYHFNRKWLFQIFAGLHKLLPDALSTGLCAFIQK